MLSVSRCEALHNYYLDPRTICQAFALACDHGFGNVTIVDPRPARLQSQKKWAGSLEHKWDCLDKIDRAFASGSGVSRGVGGIDGGGGGGGGGDFRISGSGGRGAESTAEKQAPERSRPSTLTKFGAVLRSKYDVRLPAQLNVPLVDFGAPAADVRAVVSSVLTCQHQARTRTSADESTRLSALVLSFYREHIPEKLAAGMEVSWLHSCQHAMHTDILWFCTFAWYPR